MREIKFRAWDKEEKEECEVLAIRWDITGGMQIALPLLENARGLRWLHISKVELRDFTGLKDKNGKEIFEGDIVKCFKRDSELDRINNYGWISGEGIALIKNNGWGFYYKIIKQPTEFFFNGPEGEEFYVSDFNGNTIEVIGNIYENPELLGPKKKIKCNCCLKEKEEYVSGLCKECADKMDKHIEETK